MKSVVSIFFAFVFVAQSATYYVDFSAGSDANNGTSTGTPFKHCPGDGRATGTAASTTLSAGDTVVFKGGVNYTVVENNNITLSWSGTSGSPITYDGNSDGNWGTGRAVFTDSHAYYADGTGATVFYSSANRSNLVFRFLKFFELGGSASIPADGGSAIQRNSGAGMNFSANLKDITIRDCEFSEIGYYWNAKPMDQASISGLGVQAIDFNGLTITNCNFSRMNIGLELVGYTLMTNLTVVNCSFSDSIRWCIDLPPLGTGVGIGGFEIKGNTFYNTHAFDDPQWTGYGEWPHTDNIFLRCDYGSVTYGSNINIHDNFWYNDAVSTSGGTSCIYITEGPSANVYNNVFIHTQKGTSILIANGPQTGGSAQTVNIYNNTFFDTYRNAIQVGDNGTRAIGTVNVKNNIFVDTYVGTANMLVFIDSNFNYRTNFTFDNNLWYSANTTGEFFQYVGTYGIGTANLAEMQAINWELNGEYGDPLFVDDDQGMGSNAELNDLRLTATSPAIDLGTTYSSASPDKNGTTRPVGSGYDSGAYEYSSGGGGSSSGSGKSKPGQGRGRRR